MQESVIYFLVRRDLNMGKGKIAVQCCHALQELLKSAPKEYTRGSSPKICLQIKDENDLYELETMCTLARIPKYIVYDAGLTQVPEETPTVLGIGPVTRGKAKRIVQNLRLL